MKKIHNLFYNSLTFASFVIFTFSFCFLHANAFSTETLWGLREINSFHTDNGKAWDLGVVFTPAVTGKALGARVYGAPEEAGAHSVRLWRNSDGALSCPYTFTYAGQGWHEFTFPEPISLSPDSSYTITVPTGDDAAKWYSAIPGDLIEGGSNGANLAFGPNAAVYSDTMGVPPTQSYESQNYLRDIIFVADPDSKAVPEPQSETIWGDSTPASSGADGTAWELGTVFSPTTDGTVTGIRLYAAETEKGTRTARIWDSSADTVVGGPYTFTTSGTGWNTCALPSAVALTTGQSYTVSVSTGGDSGRSYVYTSGALTSAGDNGAHLAYPANAGVYSATLNARPTQSWDGSNYFRDVVFVPGGDGAPPPQHQLLPSPRTRTVSPKVTAQRSPGDQPAQPPALGLALRPVAIQAVPFRSHQQATPHTR